MIENLCRPLRKRLRAQALTAGCAALVCLAVPALAQTVIYQEGFNSDGETNVPPRYTTTGRDVYEVPRIRSELMNADQKGPIYWAHNFEISFVGIPEIPARRMIFAWSGANDTSATSEEFLQLFESSVKWMVKDKADAVVVVGGDGRGADHHIGTERPQQVDLLLAHLVRHHEDALVAAVERSHDEAHTGVAARRLHDRAARFQASVALGSFDHRETDAVLHAAAGVQRLDLREQGRAHPH